jgi:hypothetical protein
VVAGSNKELLSKSYITYCMLEKLAGVLLACLAMCIMCAQTSAQLGEKRRKPLQ